MTDVQDKPEWLRGVLSAIPETGGQLVEGAGYRAEWPDDASSNFTHFLDLLDQHGIRYDLTCERGQPTVVLFFPVLS